MPGIIPCYNGKDVPKELKKSFNDLVDEKMSEQEQREIGKRLALDYHKKLHTELESLKREISPNPRKYVSEPYKSPEEKSDAIKEVNDHYNKLIEEKKNPTPKDVLTKAKELVNSGVVKGFSAEALKDAANNNEAEFKSHLSEIAEQAQDPRSEKATINTYGKELVDIANELFPKENISSPINKNSDGNSKSNIEQKSSESGQQANGSKADEGNNENDKNGKKENVKEPANPLNEGAASEEKGAVPSNEGGGKKPPTDTKELFGEGEDAERNKKEFDKMTSKIPNSGEVGKYLSGETMEKYGQGEPRNPQEITIQQLDPALRHGVETIEKAKEVFGEDYVTKTLDYIERENLSPENKSLLYVSLENDMAKRILDELDNLGFQKLQDLVRTKSQAYLRSNSLAINMGRLRKFAEAGYDITKVTDKFFSSKEREDKQKVEKLVQADADTINKEAEEQALKDEAPKITELDEKIKEGVEKEINQIYEKLPKSRKDYADKAIKALENFQKKLRGKAYDASLGVPVAIIDAGVTTIKLAIKAGVKVADAIELGINKIKEKFGKEWDKEKEFRADMLEGFKSSGIKSEKELNPKQYVKDALIKEGFGRTVNVKTKEGVEKRDIIDWKKLAGEEGSVSKISENVAKSLKEDNFTPDELKEMQDDFINEYTDLRTSVIEKGLNEIAARNKTIVTPEQKSAAKKLSEMYNYGLFDKDLEGYETVLAKTIGVDKLNTENLKEALVLGKSLSELFSSRFQGKQLTESQMRSAIQVIENHMRHVLHAEATSHGSTALKIADTVRSYMDLTQRMILNSLKQAAENPLSGKLETLFTKIGYSGSIPDVLSKQSSKMARDIYKEMVLQKGQNFGEVSSTFVNKGNVEMEMDKMSDNQIVQGILSTVVGRSTLDAVDSMYKAKITQQKFTYNLIKILQNDRLVDGKIQKGMSKEEAKNYVAEKLTGQSFKDAQETSKNIIDSINKSAGKKIFNDSPLFVDRLANDIVTAALVNGEKISEEMVTASYNAAYKAAGRGLGHVANNFISEGIGSVSGKLESKINEAIKEKEYKKAAMLTYASIFFRNIANPFVGGGTNWVVLKAEKTGLGLLSGLGSMMANGKKMDLTSEAGINELEKVMYQNLKVKDKFLRGAVGGVATVVGAMVMAGVTDTDEYRKWRNKNKWAAKYLDLVTPEIMLAMMAKESKQLLYYFKTAFNRNDAFDKSTMAVNAMTSAFSNERSGNSKDTPSGKVGKLVGSIFGAPTPWRLVRDGQQIWQGANGEEPYKVDNSPSETFWQGYFKGGMVDYAGYAPKSNE